MTIPVYLTYAMLALGQREPLPEIQIEVGPRKEVTVHIPAIEKADLAAIISSFLSESTPVKTRHGMFRYFLTLSPAALARMVAEKMHELK